MVLVTIVVGIKDKSSQIHVMAHRGIEWVKLVVQEVSVLVHGAINPAALIFEKMDESS